MQIYAEAESNANAKAFDWFIPQQTGDFMSHGCCGMGQAYKPRLALPRREPYMWPPGQIYAEAERRTNLFALPRREPYMWTFMAKYSE